MRICISRTLVRGTLCWTQRLFFAGAAVLLGYCGYVAADTWIYQQRESRNLQHLLENHRSNPSRGARSKLQGGARSTPRGGTPAMPSKGLIGRLEIARLGMSAMLIEGDDAKTLRRAVGHIPGTALPGQPGNVALTGHRDTFFRALRNIRENDIIVVTTLEGEYRYRVVSSRVVRPDNIAVLNAGEGEILTLVTCYPFYFVGAAPDRFIVRAERLVASRDAASRDTASRGHSISSAQSGPGGLNL
jgi:sortase A